MRRLSMLAVLAVLLLGASQSHAETMFSDDFESETVPPIEPGYIANYQDFAKWDVIGSGVDLIGPGWHPIPNHSMRVDLDGSSGSTLITKQTFDLLPSMYYTLTFDLSIPAGGDYWDTVVVELGSVFNESITRVARGFGEVPTETFTRTITVTDATSGKLSFTDLGADCCGMFLDNVRLDATAIPEPSTLVILGIGAISLLAYAWRRWK